MKLSENPKLVKIFSTVIIWGTVIWFTGLYISLLFNHNIWTDEAFTLQLLDNGNASLKEIIAGTAADVHPPLYYIYAKIFISIFGSSLLVYKAISIIPMTLLLIFGATKIRKLFGDMAAFLFLLFLTCIPCTMEFTVQVRMYSLALLLVTLCGIYAYLAFINGKKSDFFIMAICGLGAAYTHYFAFVSVIIIMGILFLAIVIYNRKRLAAWIICAICMIAGYLPWLPYFIAQLTSVEKGYWISEVTPATVWSYFTWAFDLSLVPYMVFVFIILLKGASTYNTIKIAKDKGAIEIFALLCMLVPAFTAISGTIASVAATPIYRDQYILPSLGLLALFFALSMRTAKKWVIAPIVAFLLFVGAMQYKECRYQEYYSTYVPQTEAFLEENLEENDLILYNYEVFDFIYECYFSPDLLRYSETFDFGSDYNTLWYFDTEWMPDITQETLDTYGLAMEYMGHYGIEHNEFDIYKIYRY